WLNLESLSCPPCQSHLGPWCAVVITSRSLSLFVSYPRHRK
ncbi:hypothetical protein ACJX0J_042311, partial [Zea mays]